MIGFSHIKGHPSCGFGGAFKNIALGCMIGETRGAIHDTCHYDRYWFKENCPDAETRKKIMDACPFTALVEDKEHPEELHLHIEQCNQCGRCLKVAPPGSLKIDAANFHAFPGSLRHIDRYHPFNIRSQESNLSEPGHTHDSGL